MSLFGLFQVLSLSNKHLETPFFFPPREKPLYPLSCFLLYFFLNFILLCPCLLNDVIYRSFASFGRMWLTAEGSQQRTDQVSHFYVVAYSGCLA